MAIFVNEDKLRDLLDDFADWVEDMQDDWRQGIPARENRSDLIQKVIDECKKYEKKT